MALGLRLVAAAGAGPAVQRVGAAERESAWCEGALEGLGEGWATPARVAWQIPLLRIQEAGSYTVLRWRIRDRGDQSKIVVMGNSSEYMRSPQRLCFFNCPVRAGSIERAGLR